MAPSQTNTFDQKLDILAIPERGREIVIPSTETLQVYQNEIRAAEKDGDPERVEALKEVLERQLELRIKAKADPRSEERIYTMRVPTYESFGLAEAASTTIDKNGSAVRNSVKLQKALLEGHLHTCTIKSKTPETPDQVVVFDINSVGRLAVNVARILADTIQAAAYPSEAEIDFFVSSPATT